MLDVSRATIISGGLLPPLAQSARQLLTLLLWTCGQNRLELSVQNAKLIQNEQFKGDQLTTVRFAASQIIYEGAHSKEQVPFLGILQNPAPRLDSRFNAFML